MAASHKHATLLESRLQESTTQLEQLTEKYESLSRYHTNDKMELDDIMLRLNERSVAAAEGEEEVSVCGNKSSKCRKRRTMRYAPAMIQSNPLKRHMKRK